MDNKIGNKIPSRIRSKAAWTATAAIVLGVIAKDLGIYDLVGIEQEAIQNVVTAVLALLGIWGAWNDPTNQEGF